MEKIDMREIVGRTVMPSRYTKKMYFVYEYFRDGKPSNTIYQEFRSIEPKHVKGFARMLSDTGYNGIMATEDSCDSEALNMIKQRPDIQLYHLGEGECTKEMSICAPKTDSKQE